MSLKEWSTLDWLVEMWHSSDILTNWQTSERCRDRLCCSAQSRAAIFELFLIYIFCENPLKTIWPSELELPVRSLLLKHAISKFYIHYLIDIGYSRFSDRKQIKWYVNRARQKSWKFINHDKSLGKIAHYF